MKKILIPLLFISLAITAFGQTDSGFTNRAEAKNLKVNGKKEGKWLDYMLDDVIVVMDTTGHFYRGYRLAVYSGGKLNGVVHQYDKDGQLYSIVPYTNNKRSGTCEFYDSGQVMRVILPYVDGKETGMEKFFNKKGILIMEIAVVNGKPNGSEKVYDTNGNLLSEFQNVNGKKDGVQKVYYEDGKLKKEITFTHDKAISTKNYDENGNEIKQTSN